MESSKVVAEYLLNSVCWDSGFQVCIVLIFNMQQGTLTSVYTDMLSLHGHD